MMALTLWVLAVLACLALWELRRVLRVLFVVLEDMATARGLGVVEKKRRRW